MAAKLMEKYHVACQAGDLEKARKLARQALDLDPMCFDKPVPKAAAAIDLNTRLNRVINQSKVPSERTGSVLGSTTSQVT